MILNTINKHPDHAVTFPARERNRRLFSGVDKNIPKVPGGKKLRWDALGMVAQSWHHWERLEYYLVLIILYDLILSIGYNDANKLDGNNANSICL